MEGVRSQFPKGYLDENIPASAAVTARYKALSHANQYIKDKTQQDLNEVSIIL